MISDTQRLTINAVISVFETGRLTSAKSYSTVTNIKGDTGGLSYGCHQATLMGGSLFSLIKAYCEDTGANYAGEFAPYMNRLAAKDVSLNTDSDFKALLAKAGDDRDMWQAQNEFFMRAYWQPCVDICERNHFTRALSYAVVYDSLIHGSFSRIAKITDAAGTGIVSGELAWIKRYNANRREWLANNGNALLRNCVYRQDALGLLMKADNWELRLPLTVRGVKITEDALGAGDDSATPAEAVRVSAITENPPRLLLATSPVMAGSDVEEVKQALITLGYKLDGDADYDNATVTAVKAWQAKNGLKADGIFGAVSRAKLLGTFI